MENKDKTLSLNEIKEEKTAVEPESNDEKSSSHSSSGHSSYHSHHRSHHSSHKNSRRKKANSKNKLKISNRTGWIIVVLLLVVSLAALAAYVVFGPKDNNFSNQQSGQQQSGILSVEVNNTEGLLVKNAVKQFILSDMLNPANAQLTPSSFSKGEGRLDEEVPVSLKLSVKEGDAISYKIELATDASFTNAQTNYLEGTLDEYEFRHLYTNTSYYYRVIAYTDKGIDTVVGSFTTADTPRILSVEGLSNVRDIGNWKTDSGKRIKQGLLIRGTEMDAAVESGYHLTNAGLVDMLESFNIKTDIDLRAETDTSKDALGAQVDHRYYDMVMYGDIFTEAGKDKIRMVFSDLSNPEIYPVYLHCTYGCDRTGTVCYLLEAMLGVSRGDCLKDYALSDLKIDNIKIVEEGLKAYDGDTLKEQAENYLLSCGLSEFQLQSIRDIFLGD